MRRPIIAGLIVVAFSSLGALADGINIPFSLSKLTNSISGNIALNNTNNYFDGPTVAQGTTGTWFASGTVTVADTAGAASVICKLWDGTTVIASTAIAMSTANLPTPVALSGYLASPAGNIRISCRDPSSTSGLMYDSITGLAKDGTISVLRIN